MNTQNTVETQTPIKQIQAIFADTPASALHLLYQQTEEPLSAKVRAFLELIASDYLEELTPLIGQLNYADLANWLRTNEPTFESSLIHSLRQTIANEYMAVNVTRNKIPVIRYSRTILEISPEIISVAIEQHIEGALLSRSGSFVGKKECIRFLTAMANKETKGISSFGVLVLDELFSGIITEFEKNGFPSFSAEH